MRCEGMLLARAAQYAGMNDGGRMPSAGLGGAELEQLAAGMGYKGAAQNSSLL
jgi:hypothetical protein